MSLSNARAKAQVWDRTQKPIHYAVSKAVLTELIWLKYNETKKGYK